MAHRNRKSLEVKLLSWTSGGVKLIHDLFWHDKHGRPLGWDSSMEASDREFEFVLNLLKENWCGLTEMMWFTFQMVLPRSLHAQMRVHRHMSFFSESHQLHEPDAFADDGDYFEIPGLNATARQVEARAMGAAQTTYKWFRQAGILPSLARGVLPMHVNLGLTVGMSLRTMFNTVVQRRCHILQGTYWNPLLEGMREEVKKVDPRLSQIFDLQPCDISGRCLSPIEEELRLAGKDPHAVCPRYKELKASDNISSCCGKGCQGCLKGAVKEDKKVSRSTSR
jgi:thymidylate synthase ThyX